MTVQSPPGLSTMVEPASARPALCHLALSACSSGVPVSDADREVVRRFAFRANDYYLALIDWNDPADPIRRLVMPAAAELSDDGSLDASNEAAVTPLPGLQHKYPDTALLLVTDQCACFCRYCFRKRLFEPGSRETKRECDDALGYIASHPEITDVLLTGGDPLTLSTRRLEKIVEPLLAIPHVRTVRVGSKMPAFDPSRITNDPDLAALVAAVVGSGRSFHLMTHFDHPRELTGEAVAAVGVFRRAGAQCLNQCPVSAGVNDDAGVLAELFASCTAAGCPQYYVFQCRPTMGTRHFAVPLVRTAAIVDGARARVSGLSARARLCMSHHSGKIEVMGIDDRHIYARYHRAKDVQDAGRVCVFRRDDRASWLDELVPAEPGA